MVRGSGGRHTAPTTLQVSISIFSSAQKWTRSQAVNDEGVTVKFDQGKRVYQPGELLSGGFFFSPAEGRELQAVEISVLWFTEGKGDEDMALHHFQRISFSGDDVASDPPEPRFSTRLPRSPLSYEGVIVKI